MRLANISTYQNDFSGASGGGGGYRARSYSETRDAGGGGGGGTLLRSRRMSGAFSKPLPDR